MIVKIDGKLLANNFPEKALDYIKNIINKYKKIPVNNYVRANVSGNSKLILYKISDNIFVVCLSQEDEKKLVEIFKIIYKKYNNVLIELFGEKTPKVTVKPSRIIKSIIFSKANDMGPTPIAWYPEDIDEQQKFEIAAKSILVLSAGFDQNSKHMDNTSSIIPFMNMNCIGLVYTFSIPSRKARGNSFDAAITVLVPNSYKKLLLSRLEKLELELKDITTDIKAGKNPNQLLIMLKQNFEQVLNFESQTPKTQSIDESLKKLMVSEIKKIQEKKPYSTLLY
jgi:hypothetical protein